MKHPGVCCLGGIIKFNIWRNTTVLTTIRCLHRKNEGYLFCYLSLEELRMVNLRNN